MSQKIRIKLKSYDYSLVDKSAEKIVKTVKATGAIVSGPIPLPTHKRIFTVNRSTFVNKKSREQFELSSYKRLIDIYSSTAKTVDALMKLLRNYMKTCLKTAAKNDMKIRVIGDIEPLDDDIKSRIRELEAATTDNGGLNFTIALNYGSRDELTRAAQKMAKDCAEGKIKAEEIDESVFETYLDTHGIPDPDMMIRTSGEQRLSNYLLWQLAYSEFYFTDVPWPDFTKEELVKAIEEYNHRHRRFGKVEEA